MAKKVKALKLFGERYEIEGGASDPFFFPEMKLTFEDNFETGEEGNFFVSEVLPESFVEAFENEQFRIQVWFYKSKKTSIKRNNKLQNIDNWKHAPDGLVESLLSDFTPPALSVLGAARTGYAQVKYHQDLDDTESEIISTLTSPTHFNGYIRTELEVTVNDVFEKTNGKKYLKIKLTPFILSVLANGLYIEHKAEISNQVTTKEIYLKKSVIGPGQVVKFDNTYFKNYSNTINNYQLRSVWGSKKKYGSISGIFVYGLSQPNNHKLLIPFDQGRNIIKSAPVGIRLVASKNGTDLLFGRIEKTFFNMRWNNSNQENKVFAKLTTRQKAAYFSNEI